ncbi:MAG: DegT/DnrJ/EryC1/StrS family aminotransferase [Pseudomonadota bacterium]
MSKVVSLDAVKASQADRPIAFIDLKAQGERLRPKIDAAVTRVLDHGAYVNGPEIDELEAKLKAYTGAADAVAVSSGTDALVIAMMGEEIGVGDAVFIPAFTYNATANAVLMVGATPVFVDVDPETFNLCPRHLEQSINAVKKSGALKPKAIVGVDLFGRPADYDAIHTIAAADELIVMADAAQSFGGTYKGKRVGAAAPISGTSFFPAKGLGCYGDGGAMFTMDPDKGALWRSIRFHGTDEGRRISVRVGLNGRLDTFQAAILLVKLSVYDEEWQTRAKAAAVYESALEGVVGLPRREEGVVSSYGLFSVLLPEAADRDGIQARLKEDGIPTAIYYPVPLHRQPAFESFTPAGGLPATEMCAERILALPMHPYLSEEQAAFVCEKLQGALA